MTYSMTGYGRGEAEAPDQKWVVEIRSLNHRFLEVALNLPRRLWTLEDRLRSVIKGKIHRGRLEVHFTMEAQGEKAPGLRLDPEAVAAARALLTELRTAGGMEEPLRLKHFLHFPEIIASREKEPQDLEETWSLLSQAINLALEDLEAMRRAEGATLEKELRDNLLTIGAEAARISLLAAQQPEIWRDRLAARLKELLADTALDETRLAQEVALLAEKRDLTEELARLNSHIQKFQEVMEGGGPVGRKLEFLLQEMLREANTIGSKGGDLVMVQAVLEIKAALERLREQVQNIE
jgi:uncharacterized protein (TIGR00255 family)